MVLRALAGRNLLFSEAHQAIYELDDLAAYVWRSLDRGMTPDLMVREMVEAGIAAEDAWSVVRTGVRWLGPIRDAETSRHPRPLPESTEGLTSRTLDVAGVVVRLDLSYPLLDTVDAVFAHLRTASPETEVQLCARLAGDRVRLLPAGRPEWSCDLREFVPVLKALLVEEVIQSARYEVALHAAAFVRNERVLLLVGSPGAGKTTLGLALARVGFDLAADDVVLLAEDGLVTGLPFAPAVKEGSWPLLARHWPGILDRPTYRRPDGKEVRYFLPNRVAAPRPRPIGLVALLDRRSDVKILIADIDPADALAALIAEGAARDRRLSARGFDSLVSALGGARCCRVTYCDLVEATNHLCDLFS